MTGKLRKIVGHPLFSGSAVMIVGTNLTNVLNYLYHLVMGRLLGPALYGELAALFSLVGILGVLTVALNLVIVKYIASAKNGSEVKNLAGWFGGKMLLLAALLGVLIIIFSPLIAAFLQVKNVWLVSLVAFSAAFSLLSATNKAILQGLLRFNRTVAAILAETGTKLILGVLLVLLGFAVGGAMAGLVVAAALGWIVSGLFLRGYSGRVTSGPDTKSILLYALPVLVQSVAITSLYSTDLLLVKHFFAPQEAGIYAATSTLGRIIYFGASPVGLVMFPLVSGRSARGESFRNVVLWGFALTAGLSVVILALFGLFPAFSVSSLYGASYLKAVNLLFGFGVFIVFFTLAVFLVNFHLSLRRVRVVILPFLAATAQLIGIWLFHNNLGTVISISILTSGLLLISLLLYSVFGKKVAKK